jgi:hypothetical protein
MQVIWLFIFAIVLGLLVVSALWSIGTKLGQRLNSPIQANGTRQPNSKSAQGGPK